MKEAELQCTDDESIAPALSFILVSPLLIHTVLMGDWYGVSSRIAITISIFVRSFLLWQLRQARDKTDC